LSIEWYSKDVHNCVNGCAPNICKGRELQLYYKDRQYDKIFYIGDGKNDFCPCTKIGINDVALAREGYGFAKLLRDEVKKSLISAQILHWESPSDIYNIIKRFLE
jgi:pyridoxal phosphate phosphatase PHOSPHO2